MRKTKIVCTIGPASTDEKIITDMCKAGMNVARLNFSHGTHEEQQKKIDIIKKVRTKLNLPIAVMLDTKGPEYRIRTFKDGKIELKAGAPFTFTTDEVEGDQTIVSVSYKNLNKEELDEDYFLCQQIRADVVAELFDAIDELPDRCKEIFKRSYVDGQEERKIAEELNISLNTIKTQKQRAKSYLRGRLGDLFVYAGMFFPGL